MEINQINPSQNGNGDQNGRMANPNGLLRFQVMKTKSKIILFYSGKAY